MDEFNLASFLEFWIPLLIQFAPGIVIALIVYIHMKQSVKDAYDRGLDTPSPHQQDEYDKLMQKYDKVLAEKITLQEIVDKYFNGNEDKHDN